MTQQATQKIPQPVDTLAIFFLDREGLITGLNRNAELLTGRPLADLFGTPMNRILAADGHADSLAGIFAHIDWDQAQARNSLLVNLDQNGTQIEVLANILPVWGRTAPSAGLW